VCPLTRESGRCQRAPRPHAPGRRLRPVPIVSLGRTDDEKPVCPVVRDRAIRPAAGRGGPCRLAAPTASSGPRAVASTPELSGPPHRGRPGAGPERSDPALAGGPREGGARLRGDGQVE